MRSRDFAELFACRLFGAATKSGPQAQSVMDQANQQSNMPNFSPAGGGGVSPPSVSNQPAPQWGAPPTQGPDSYRQTPPKRSPYA